MKLTIDKDHLRLRMSEADLDTLLADGRIAQTWNGANGTTAHCALMLAAESDTDDCQGDLMQLQVTLARERFLAFAAERPRRDGYAFTQNRLRIDVEVDVRDSHRRRTEKSAMADTAA